MQLAVFEDAASATRAAAQAVAERIQAAVARSGRCSLALAGGSTPRQLYRLLAERRELPWARVDFFQGDERWVAATHADSNLRMARESLLEPLCIEAARVHPIDTAAQDPESAARDYAAELERQLGAPLPIFDLVLLGMGPDGHTASLFPASSALAEREHSVVANWVEQLATWRVTLTYPTLCAARCVLVLACGADKHPAFARVRRAGPDAPPIAQVRPRQGELLWFVDRALAHGS